MAKHTPKPFTRLQDLLEVHPAAKIEAFFDEALENHIRQTSLPGPVLADQFFILTELKEVLRELKYQ
jgi:hypothetical protein